MALTIRKILKQNWKDYLKNHEVLHYQKEEVEKSINCSRKSCNGRICTSCGKRYADEWADKMEDYLLPARHNHIVLTMPAALRENFRNWRNLKLLMDSSARFMQNSFLIRGKKKPKIAIITVLHTFGKDLKFNPHLHLIAAKGFFDKNNKL